MNIGSIPRIRARVAEITDPKDLCGQWAFEVSVWTFDGETQIGDNLGPFGPYPSKEEALQNMNDAVRMCAEMAEKKMTGQVSGKYFDMKNGGVLRPWDSQ